MKEFSKTEKVPEIDFLSENLHLTFEVDPSVVKHLPVVTPEDQKTGRERFGVLLGRVSLRGDGRAHVAIKGVYQEEDGEAYGSYKEGIEEVTYNLSQIQEKIRTIRRRDPQYSQFHWIGDVHTHPVSGVPVPSDVDIEAQVNAYESGSIERNRLFLFGIGALREDGEMEYRLYRLIQTERGYSYALVDWG
jgi:proteasome lid subunit RPN8/RPN11